MSSPISLAVQEAIEEHVRASLPGGIIDPFSWMLGPIRKSMPDFHVFRVSPVSTEIGWTYISCGAWKIDAKESFRQEFCVLSPHESPSHVETLAMLTNLYVDIPKSVSIGSVIDIGRPWMDGATCSHFLVSLPYPIGPKFEFLKVSDVDLVIRFLWLVPITRDEAAFVKTDGVEALEQRFESSEIDFLDLARSSVFDR